MEMEFVDKGYNEVILRQYCIRRASDNLLTSIGAPSDAGDVIQYAEALHQYISKGTIPAQPLAKAA